MDEEKLKEEKTFICTKACASVYMHSLHADIHVYRKIDIHVDKHL